MYVFEQVTQALPPGWVSLAVTWLLLGSTYTKLALGFSPIAVAFEVSVHEPRLVLKIVHCFAYWDQQTEIVHCLVAGSSAVHSQRKPKTFAMHQRQKVSQGLTSKCTKKFNVHPVYALFPPFSLVIHGAHACVVLSSNCFADRPRWTSTDSGRHHPVLWVRARSALPC